MDIECLRVYGFDDDYNPLKGIGPRSTKTLNDICPHTWAVEICKNVLGEKGQKETKNLASAPTAPDEPVVQGG